MDKLNNKTSINTIFREFLNRYPKQFTFLFFLLIIEGLAAALSMLAIIPMADYLLDPSMLKVSRITLYAINIYSFLNIKVSFWSFGFLFVILNFIKGLLEVGVKFAILKIKYNVTRGLFGETLEVFFKAKWGFFSNTSNGVLLNTLNKELTTIGDTLGHMATLLAQVIQFLIFLAVPFALNFKLTFIVISTSILIGLPFLLLNKLSYSLGKRNTETANNAMSILSELLQSTRLILGYGKQNKSKDKYLQAFDKHVNITLSSQTLSTAIPKFFQPLAMMAVVISIGISITKNTPISELTAVMWSFLAALPILASLLQGNISINNFIPSYEQLVNLKNKAFELREINGNLLFNNLKKSIKLNNVSFEYPGRLNTLSNLNIIINKGEMTALIGESGSGKSTITDLIIGLQIPNNGDILIDEIPLSKYDQNTFRQKIGYVPQEPMLFNTTIRENLLWAEESASEIELWDVLKLANADKFVMELPNRLDTLVGDRGVRLSGGQRQRIALARALIRNPELLILDEATSALDSESEILIQSSIENLSKNITILIIAHRLSTISKANMVYILSRGKLVEEGSYNILVNNTNSILNQMINTQQKDVSNY